MGLKIAPLPGTTMLISMIGLFISGALFVRVSPSYGFAFAIIFLIMFIASLLSTYYGDAEKILHMDEKAFHKEQGYKKKMNRKLKKMKSPAIKNRA